MSQRGDPPKKKDSGFNTPFAALKALKKAAEPAPAPARAKAPPPPPPKPARPLEEDDAALFYAAMDGVDQLTRRGEAPKPNPVLPQILDDNAEALAQLAELVSGQGEFEVAKSDEFIEGASGGTGDRALLEALRRGDFRPQAQLDLHGLTQSEARDAVERFLTESRRARKRCVLVVHGRGLNSKDQIPVLKQQLQSWLSQKRIGKLVLAFATARPQDGGAGALYVLLRH
ncbi:MAG TPA: Smr/MutS family protein [Aggregicoccus sp.]|nr:Smr/MutS family protein [Aggregicoccus sp.]